MKKTMAWLFGVGVMLAVAVPALAEDLEVQLIGGEDTAVGAASLDDVQLGETYEIDGFARIKPLSFEYRDYFYQYASGMNGQNEIIEKDTNDGEAYYGFIYGGGNKRYVNIYDITSGTDAEYAWFLVDIDNRKREPATFMDENTEVKVIFDDQYEYAGWVRQFNYNYDTERVHEDPVDGTFVRAAIQPDSEEPLDQMYTGHYVFGCTLPNAVVNGEEPLSMIITLGDSEITYNIRK